MSRASNTPPEHLKIIPHFLSKPILTADLTAGLTAEASKYGSGKLENRPYKWLENWKFPEFPAFPILFYLIRNFTNPKMIFTTF